MKNSAVLLETLFKAYLQSQASEKKTSKSNKHKKTNDNSTKFNFSKNQQSNTASTGFLSSRKLKNFLKKIKNMEKRAKKFQGKQKISIKKCMFGFFLDYSRDKCSYLPSRMCNLKCGRRLSPIPGLCYCVETPSCNIEQCLKGLILSRNCKCVQKKTHSSSKKMQFSGSKNFSKGLGDKYFHRKFKPNSINPFSF